ncbi:MAG: hypothetical protein CL917_12130 [Deltaproteobacteria bacterium]|nr:hypothetical protein [Deltaproteobacteria bacterium]
MSTILKALRRLEADEQRKTESQTLLEGEVTSPRRRLALISPIWLLGGLAVLLGAGVGIGLRAWWAESPAPVSVTEAKPSSLPPMESPREPFVQQQSEPRLDSRPLANPRAVVEDAPRIVARSRTAEPVDRPPALKQPEPQKASTSTTVAAGPVRVVSDLPVAQARSVPEKAVVQKTPVAEGPVRSVAALPKVTRMPDASSAPLSKNSISDETKAAPVAVAKEKSPKPDLPKADQLRAKPSPTEPTGSAVLAPKIAAKAQPARKEVALSKPPVIPSPVPVLEVVVMRTVWHPTPAKRSVYLSADGRPSETVFTEGDLWQGWKVVEIKLSGVSFERQGVRVERRVGQAR